jgi:predicted Zn finger-like uncharacterized protein
VLEFGSIPEPQLNDSDLRYTFACPSCSGSFSIGLDKIPPVQARFSCPKCGKPMDFPSREEARVYVRLQAQGGAAAADPPPAAEPERAAAPERPPEPPPKPRPRPEPVAPEAQTPAADKQYEVDKKGFENDVYDRRAMRNLIRTGAVNEFDQIRVGQGEAVRAADLPELRSLFELRKTAKTEPPPVCRKHTDRVAFYTCVDTARPICEECAEEKKFGGTSVRVCNHCGGNAQEIPVQLES